MACVYGLGIAGMTCVELAQGDDLHLRRRSLLGERRFPAPNKVRAPAERAVTSSPAGHHHGPPMHLKRTVTVNEQSQSYVIADDPGGAAIKAAALMARPAAPAGQTITLSIPSPTPGSASNCSATRRGTKNHRKGRIARSSCSLASQNTRLTAVCGFTKEQGLCQAFLPPVVRPMM